MAYLFLLVPCKTFDEMPPQISCQLATLPLHQYGSANAILGYSTRRVYQRKNFANQHRELQTKQKL